MRHFRTTWILALVLAFLPLLAFGAEQHKSFTLDQKAEIGNHQLKPGQYTLKFDDSSNQTNVLFQRDGKTVASAPAQVMHKKNTDNAQYEINTANGNQLNRVWVNSHEELAFGDQGMQKNGLNSSQNATPPAQ